jgi:DNA-3-methyladenine glycosylase
VKKIPHTFFYRKTLLVSRELLGKYLVRRIGKKIIREKITEVEAYVGPHDLACHSARGRTERNKIMFEKAGTIYVYFTYGMHWMLNIITEEENFPAGILIRGTESYKGPGVVTKNLKIDKSLNGKKLGEKTGLWIEDGEKVFPKQVRRTARIGINSTPEPWLSKKYRFVMLQDKSRFRKQYT